MPPDPDQRGRCVLVIEDEFYVAMDTKNALQRAGIAVAGPCRTEGQVREEIARHRPDAAVIDINLGEGRSFALAHALREQKIPFVFFTGYDQASIPAQFSDVERVEKPADLSELVDAVSRLLTRAPAGVEGAGTATTSATWF